LSINEGLKVAVTFDFGGVVVGAAGYVWVAEVAAAEVAAA